MSTRVTRDVKKTLANLAGAAAIAFVTYWLFWRPEREHDTGVLVWMITIPAIAGAAFFAWRAAKSGTAPCPGCGHTVTDLYTSENRGVVCRFCGKYLEGTGGSLHLTADDAVADDWIFVTTVPHTIAWPDGCCVCGAPATRTVRIEVTEKQDAAFHKDLATRVATLGTMKLVEETTHALEVPHCDAHGNGAELRLAGDSVTGLAIAFRSHRYLNAFCEKNGTLPRT